MLVLTFVFLIRDFSEVRILFNALLSMGILLIPPRKSGAILTATATMSTRISMDKKTDKKPVLFRLPVKARQLYLQALREHEGTWTSNSAISIAELTDAIDRAEKAPGTKVIKTEDRIRVLHAHLLERDALIKRYDLIDIGDRLKYLFRVSRARRAWAAAKTLTDLGIPTPEPLGFLEIRSGLFVARSYFITAFMSDARSARKWIKPWLSAKPPEFRERFRKEILNLLLDLYRNGIYHGDTKSANILLRSPDEPDRRAFFWIDLECVKFGVRPRRRQIIRNLVQMNGSLGSKVSEEDRMAFLHDMSQFYPWLARPRVAEKIRAWTRRRLLKQKHGWHGA
jgi:hypothetical protein